MYLYLYCTECIEEVGVLLVCWTKPPTRVLAALNEVEHLFLVHPVELSHQVHGRQAPVHSTHAEELCHAVLLSGH